MVTTAFGPSAASTSSSAALIAVSRSGWKRFSSSPRVNTNTAPRRSKPVICRLHHHGVLPESDGAHRSAGQRSASRTGSAKYPPLRSPLPGDRDADVCIVGAGYTGLWTAYYLKRADPSLRIVVLEARFAGFGASGRNGGWLSGLVPGDRNRMAKLYGRDRVLAWQRALNDAVDEVIDVAAQEGIDAGIVKGGTLQIARNPAQATRLAAEIAEERSWKVDGIAALTKAEAAQRIRLDGVVSAYHTPHCARVQPARLARGLADAVERLGVDIYEQSPVTRSRPARRPRRRAPSPRRSCCARRRASPPRCPGCGGAGCR